MLAIWHSMYTESSTRFTANKVSAAWLWFTKSKCTLLLVLCLISPPCDNNKWRGMKWSNESTCILLYIIYIMKENWYIMLTGRPESNNSDVRCCKCLVLIAIALIQIVRHLFEVHWSQGYYPQIRLCLVGGEYLHLFFRPFERREYSVSSSININLLLQMLCNRYIYPLFANCAVVHCMNARLESKFNQSKVFFFSHKTNSLTSK